MATLVQHRDLCGKARPFFGFCQNVEATSRRENRTRPGEPRATLEQFKPANNASREMKWSRRGSNP
jgi:hypothetical protein